MSLATTNFLTVWLATLVIARVITCLVGGLTRGVGTESCTSVVPPVSTGGTIFCYANCMNYSVILIKPRAKELGIDKEAKEFLDRNDLEITEQKPVCFTEELMVQFAPHVKPEHLPSLLDYLNEDETVACLVQGEGALNKCLELRAQIREEYKTVQPYTYIHASDSSEAAEREKQVVFEN